MSSIEYSRSPALVLALDLEQNFKSQEPWILNFERAIATARKDYDLENEDYDRRERYPEKVFLEERYTHWTNLLSKFSQEHQRLVDVSSELHRKLTQLEWALLDQGMFAKLKFIHTDAGKEIDDYHAEVNSKTAVLIQSLHKIQELAKEALKEISNIRYHPHRRLQQTISRVANGQYASTYACQIQDRVTRNLSSAGSAVWGSQTTYGDMNQQTSLPASPPPQEPGQKEDNDSIL